jgi:energy-coupling factor transport system ATP-binding protein
VLQNPDRQLFQSRVADELGGEQGHAILRRLGLWALRHRHPRTLSFGQKRRLTVARMLARAPTLLVVDEPSIGQDAGHLGNLFRVLGDYLRDGGALLATSHDARVAAAFGGPIWRLSEGRLRQE